MTSSEPPSAPRQVQWLKRRLAKSLSSPAEALNRDTGGTYTYRDIRFTREAAVAYRSSVEWRQFPTGNVLFRLAEDSLEQALRDGVEANL